MNRKDVLNDGRKTTSSFLPKQSFLLIGLNINTHFE